MYRGLQAVVTWDDNYCALDEASDWRQNWSEPEVQWQAASLALSKVATLEADWDGEGAAAPDLEVVNSVGALLTQLRSESLSEPPSRVLPTPDGGVLVEWQGNGYYRELEVFTPFEGEVMTVLSGREPLHGELRWRSLEEVADQRNKGESLLVWTDRRVAVIANGYCEAA